MEDSARRNTVVLFVVALAWLAGARLLASYAAGWLPRSLAAQLTLHSYLSLVLVVVTLLGLALSRAVLPAPRDALGLARPTASHVAIVLLAAPVVSVLSAYLAYKLALPTLIAEIVRGGKQAAEANTGQFGRALVQSHAATTLVWATLLTPVAEELIFRGALWSAITDVSRRFEAGPRSLPAELLRETWLVRALGRLRRWLVSGGAATLITAATFAWMHADQSGGAGIVRVVQTACLGLALGSARHATRSVVPPMALHAAFNLMAVAKLRRWVESPGWPPPLPIATVYWQFAAGCSVVLLVWLGYALVRRRTTA